MVSIVEVTTKAQLRRFVEYPMELYKDVPQYIPGTYDDDLEDWDKKKNPAFEYCQARCWLAMRDGEIVGRIGAILSRKANEKWHTNRLRFTQVDFIDDYQVSRALFATVEDWARQLGCTQIHGPLGFTDLDREGLLVEGFDRRSCFFTYYNHPYYKDHLEALGYAKDVDWIEELITAPTDEAVLQRWEKLSNYVLKRQKLHVKKARTRLDYPGLVPAGEHGLFPAVWHGGAVRGADQALCREVCPTDQPTAHLLRYERGKRDGGLRRGGSQHRRGPAQAQGQALPHRMGGSAEGLPEERHRGPAADRRAAGPAEQGRQRRGHQPGDAGCL